MSKNEYLRVTFYMKSGNSFTVDLDKLEYEHTGGRLTGLTWIKRNPNRLTTVDVDSIEAIVSTIMEK